VKAHSLTGNYHTTGFLISDHALGIAPPFSGQVRSPNIDTATRLNRAVLML
jgi:hypothetical protein